MVETASGVSETFTILEGDRIVEVRGRALAPHDFTIRRGTMPMRGADSMGPEFHAMLQDRVKAGKPYYRPLPDTAGTD